MADLVIKGILSFPHLFKARAVDAGSAPKFSTTLLVQKTDPQLQQVQARIEQEQAAFPGGWPDSGKVFIKPSKHYPDYVEIRTSTAEQYAPEVVGMDRQPLIDQGKAYPGVVAYVSFNPYTYNMTTSKGVAAGLNGVLVTDEEGALGRLDSRPDASSMFNSVPGAPDPVAGSAAAPKPDWMG